MEDALACTSWKNTNAYKNYEFSNSQVDFYEKHGASPEVLNLVKLSSKSFGTVSEKIISEIFQLDPRKSPQHDACLPGTDLKIEIKTARYWVPQFDCTWQHLEPDHDYDLVLFCLLDFTKWRVWAIRKDTLMSPELRNVAREKRSAKPVNYQGTQGWWTRKSSIQKWLTPVYSANCLRKFARV